MPDNSKNKSTPEVGVWNNIDSCTVVFSYDAEGRRVDPNEMEPDAPTFFLKDGGPALHELETETVRFSTTDPADSADSADCRYAWEGRELDAEADLSYDRVKGPDTMEHESDSMKTDDVDGHWYCEVILDLDGIKLHYSTGRWVANPTQERFAEEAE
jgi:hypothetical protein